MSWAIWWAGSVPSPPTTRSTPTRPNGRAFRDGNSVKKKIKGLCNKGIISGEPHCPDSIKFSKATQRKIMVKIEMEGFGDEKVGDEEENEAKTEAVVSDRPVRTPVTTVANPPPARCPRSW